MKSPEKQLLVLYVSLALLFVPVYTHFVSPNEFSRWLTVSALIENGTLEVSERLALIGGRNEDLSEFAGRVYSNKAPGAALVSIPGYAAARLFVQSTSFRVVLTAMRLCTSTIPLLLVGLAFVRLSRRWKIDDVATRLALSALLFATPLFAYSLLLFSHAIVAATLFGAWMLFFTGEENGKRDVAAGALLGLAVVSEYPAAIPALALVVVAAWPHRWRRVAAVAAGALPFALMLMTYNAICFGGPFELSSGHERFAGFSQLAGRGVFGVSWPDPSIAFRLLFSPTRGLFFFSPILAFGAWALFEQRRERAFLAALLASLSMLLFYAGYPNWHGGWTVGARYLVAVVPFLCLGLLRREATPLARVLIGYSITAVMLTTLVFPYVPEDFPAPWLSFGGPLLWRGVATPNLFALPAAFVVIAAVLVVIVISERKWMGWVGVAAAIVVGLIALGLSTPRRELMRAYIADVYFQQEGTLRRIGAPPRLLGRAEVERKLPPQPLD